MKRKLTNGWTLIFAAAQVIRKLKKRYMLFFLMLLRGRIIMDTIYDILSSLDRHQSKKAVLATIIHVYGSSYRKEGTSMVIFEDSTYTGVLTAGCLEADLIERSKTLLKQKQAFQLYTYDLRSENDLSWGRGAGCNGRIQIILEPIDQLFQEQLFTLYDHLRNGRPVLSIRKLSLDYSKIERTFIPYEYEERTKRWFGQQIDGADDFLCAPKPYKKYSGLRKKNKDDLEFQQLYWPQPNLYIIGAGVDAKPLADTASRTGFQVHIIDWRPALCNKEYFPSVSHFHIRSFDQGFQDIGMTPLDSVMVMTHQFEQDKEALRDLRHRDLFYLGVLGPKKRTTRLLEGERPAGNLDSPAGLDIAAEGPNEIAISILAKVIGRMRKEGEQPHA
nr:XdhC family protein [Scopulibacillus darangshiensis]